MRRGILGFDMRRRARLLAERGLVVSPARRRFGGLVVAGPTLGALALCAMGLASTAPLDEVEWPLSIMIMGTVPVTLATAFVWNLRPGFHGRDPRTRRGIDVTDAARDALSPSASQAPHVVTGGFAAMTDERLRDAVRGTAAESRWNVGRSRRAASADLNALLAVQGWDSGGGSDSGGDAGDGGAGGD